MENNQQPKSGNRKKFNFYWIYAILTVVLFALYFAGKDETAREDIDMGQLNELLQRGEVSKIDLVNKEIAEIYLKEDPKTVRYTYRIGSLDRFEESVDQVQRDHNIKDPVYINNIQRKSWGGEFLIGWLPLILLIVFWI